MTNPADIVTRLRQGWLAHQDKDARFVQVNTQEWMRCTDLTREAAIEIERLRAERDEARRLLCDEIWMSRGGRMSVDLIARERGWDCFKEASDEQ